MFKSVIGSVNQMFEVGYDYHVAVTTTPDEFEDRITVEEDPLEFYDMYVDSIEEVNGVFRIWISGENTVCCGSEKIESGEECEFCEECEEKIISILLNPKDDYIFLKV